MLWKRRICGGHFREESVELRWRTKRRSKRDENFNLFLPGNIKGEPKDAVLHKEDLELENIEVKTRRYQIKKSYEFNIKNLASK